MELADENTPWGWADGKLHPQLPLWDSPRQTSSTISWAGFFLQWCPTGARGPGRPGLGRGADTEGPFTGYLA